MENKPQVGVASFVINKDGKILLGKRKSDYGFGLWGLPGGKLKLCENPETAAIRETMEETGMYIKIEEKFTFVSSVTNVTPEHWITLLYICTPLNDHDEPKLTEPDKFYTWKWFYINDIQSRPDLFYPLDAFFSNKQYVKKLNEYVRKYGFQSWSK